MVIYITHTQYIGGVYVRGPVDTLVELEKQRGGEYIFISLGMNGSNINLISKKGEDEVTLSLFNGFTKYISDFFYVLSKLPIVDDCIIVAADPLNFIYSWFKCSKIKIFYYTLDYTPSRFSNPILNKLYHALDRFAVSKCHVQFCASMSIISMRKSQMPELNNLVYLPNSPSEEPLKKPQITGKLKMCMTFSNHKQVDFVFLFHGLTLLKLKNIPFELYLIGVGDFEQYIKTIEFYENIKSEIQFHSPTKREDLFEIIRSCNIGFEMNDGARSDNIHRDPIKIREYINFGLVTITKPGHAIVNEIISNKIGILVENSIQLGYELIALKSDEALFQLILNNVQAYSKKYSIKKIHEEYIK
jgi:hypothetical protein